MMQSDLHDPKYDSDPLVVFARDILKHFTDISPRLRKQVISLLIQLIVQSLYQALHFRNLPRKSTIDATIFEAS
jgi:hypothetical protein